MNRWNKQFDTALRRIYGLSVDDAGLDSLALLQWRALHPCAPEHAVWAYGVAMKLEPMESVLDGHAPVAVQPEALEGMDAVALLRKLIEQDAASADECEALAARTGSPVNNELLRDAGQYRQSIHRYGLVLAALASPVVVQPDSEHVETLLQLQAAIFLPVDKELTEAEAAQIRALSAAIAAMQRPVAAQQAVTDGDVDGAMPCRHSNRNGPACLCCGRDTAQPPEAVAEIVRDLRDVAKADGWVCVGAAADLIEQLQARNAEQAEQLAEVRGELERRTSEVIVVAAKEGAP